MMKSPEKYRMNYGPFASTAADGNNGGFVIPFPLGSDPNNKLAVIASDGMGWEHVSVSAKERVPSWDEMCHVKNLFWDEEDCVIQFHPPKSEYVNIHSFVLHLWRPAGRNIETPPRVLV